MSVTISMLSVIKAGLEQPAGRTWSIRSADQRIGRGAGSYTHTFLMLVDETQPQKPVLLDELHFIAENARGQAFKGRAALLSNALNVAAMRLGLEKQFTRAANAAGVGDRLFFLKAMTQRSRTRAKNLGNIPSAACATGTPRQMLAAWNDTCRAAIEIDRRRPLFASHGPVANNCRTASKAAAESAGYAFRAAAADTREKMSMNIPRAANGNENNALEDYVFTQQRLRRELPHRPPR